MSVAMQSIAEQMAMVLTAQKPTQRARIGECCEGLPGSTKSVACMERNVQNTSAGSVQAWETRRAPVGLCIGCAHHSQQVGRSETTSRETISPWESDQPIVLRDGSAGHMGKGLTGIRSL